MDSGGNFSCAGLKCFGFACPSVSKRSVIFLIMFYTQPGRAVTGFQLDDALRSHANSTMIYLCKTYRDSSSAEGFLQDHLW